MDETEQMKQIFAEGGITDDGMERDPVSGNEVPPGSLAEEVRDDVPARLSTGEYVVPADVVRYFGVAYFEKLRKKAKEGLGQMEADGRIGGEPVDEDFPFSDEELEFEEDNLEMAEGGIVTTRPDMSLLQRPGQPSFDRTQFSLGVMGQGLESRRYINPQTGEQRMVQFMNGQPLGAIPQGFVPYTEELAQQTTQAQVTDPTAGLSPTQQLQTSTGPGRTQEERDNREGITGGDSEDRGGGFGARNYDRLTEDPLGFAKEALDPTLIDRGIVGGVGMFAGPVAGLAVKEGIKLENIAQANAAKQVAQAQGLDTTEIDKLINDAVSGLSGAARTLYNSGKVATGDNYSQSYFDEQTRRTVDTTPTTPVSTPTVPTATSAGLASRTPVQTITPAEQRTAQAPATSTAPPPRPASITPSSGGSERAYESRGVTYNVKDDGDRVTATAVGSTAPTSSPRAPSRPDRSQEERDARDSVGGGRTGAPRGGRATGGLVAKPTKKRSKRVAK